MNDNEYGSSKKKQQQEQQEQLIQIKQKLHTTSNKTNK
jgi:hypothetical protein